MTNAARIAELNDQFRKDGRGRGRLLITRGIVDLGVSFQAQVITKVRQFSEFDEDNNPHGERDFGAFDLDDQRIFWKLDYYDLSMQAGSDDPSDPNKTTRVLTIMLASEY